MKKTDIGDLTHRTIINCYGMCLAGKSGLRENGSGRDGYLVKLLGCRPKFIIELGDGHLVFLLLRKLLL